MADKELSLSVTITGLSERELKLSQVNTDLLKLSESKKSLTKAFKDGKISEDEFVKRMALVGREINDAKNKQFELNKELGNFSGIQSRLMDVMKDLGTKFLALTGLTVGFNEAIKFAKDVITSTGESADRFSFTIEGIKQGFDRVKVAIQTLDFKDFVKNVKAAIEEGKRYAEGLDDVDDKTRALKIAEAEGRNELMKQREIQNDVRKSLDERNKAGKEAIKIEENLQKLRVDIADQAYKNELQNIVSISHATENQVLAYVKREEVFMKGFDRGKQYLELTKQQEENDKKITDLIQARVPVDSKLYDIRKNLNEELAKFNYNDKEYADIVQKVTIPTDEKYAVLTEKIIALEEAKGSALENTLKIRAKNANIENQLNKDASNAANQLSPLGYDYASSMAELQAASDAAMESEQAFLDQKKIMEDKAWEEGLKAAYENYRKQKAAAEQNARDIIDIDFSKLDAKREIANAESDVIGSTGVLLKSLAGKNKALAITGISIDKGAAIAQIIANIGIANAKARAVSPLTLGQPWVTINRISGISSIAEVIAQSAREISKISGYVGGGRITGGIKVDTGTKDDTLIVANREEAVVNKRQIAALGGSRAMRFAGVPGFEYGGSISGQAPYIPPSEMSNMNANLNSLIQRISNLEVHLNVNKLNAAQREVSIINNPSAL